MRRMPLTMRTIAAAAIMMMLATSSVSRAQNYVIDQGTSDALTRYLYLNDLPPLRAAASR